MGAGCDRPIRPEAVRDEVIKADPEFATTLAKRDELASKVALLERELALKERQVEQQIKTLRRELDQARATVNEKISKTRGVIAPYWERLDVDLSMAGEELHLKRSQRANIGHRISTIRKALKRKQPAWTDEERVRMDRELADLLKETGRLDAEIRTLVQHIRLLKLKRVALRL